MSKYDFNSLKRIQVKKMTSTVNCTRQMLLFIRFTLKVSVSQKKEDILELIHFARENKIPLIPRAGGTSLAGQVVGNGLVVDV